MASTPEKVNGSGEDAAAANGAGGAGAEAALERGDEAPASARSDGEQAAAPKARGGGRAKTAAKSSGSGRSKAAGGRRAKRGSGASTAANAAGDATRAAGEAAGGAATAAGDAAKAAGDATRAAGEVAGGAATAVGDAAGGAAKGAGRTAKDAGDAAGDAAKGAGRTARAAGTAAGDAATGAGDALAGVATAAADAVATGASDGDGGAPRARGGGGGADVRPREAAAGLDAMLTEAAVGPVRSWIPGRAGVKFAFKLATRPDVTVRRSVELGLELARVAAGRSELAAPKRDRRFKDPAWNGNPVLKRLLQTYLAVGRTTDRLICDADLEWRGERRIRFAAENVLDAIAPSNSPVLNPEALKAALDTGGRNYVRGLRNLAKDMRRPPRVPSMVDTSAFKVGENLALTKGSVVLRTPVLELIQYDPLTPRVRERPLLITPPQINKFYITDLAPNRSMVEHQLRNGQQVFTISWRNPDQRHAEWTLDTYVQGVIDALDATQEITGADQAHVLGLCAGGITASCAVAHLAASDQLDRVAGFSLGVTVLDNAQSGTVSAFVDPAVARVAIADSARRGYLDGRALAGVFAWLRPNDLVWNYWVNNYLLGKDPPPFDILYWNSDTTNLPAGLHRDFVNIAMNNALVRPGEVTVLGTPVDLGAITVDSYLVAGIADHITPWTNCYRSVHLLGSDPRFVLSTSGHIAALVNPPGNEKSSYQLNDANPEDPEAWLAGATTRRGTWWDDWAAWLAERSGDERDAPSKPGGKGYKPLAKAPGTYVLQ